MNSGPGDISSSLNELRIILSKNLPEFESAFDRIKAKLSTDHFLEKVTYLEKSNSLLEELINLAYKGKSTPFQIVWRHIGSSFDIEKLLALKFKRFFNLDLFNVLAIMAANGDSIPFFEVFKTHSTRFPLEKLLAKSTTSSLSDYDKDHIYDEDDSYEEAYDRYELAIKPFLTLLSLSEKHSTGAFTAFWDLYKNRISFKDITQDLESQIKEIMRLPFFAPVILTPIYQLVEAAKEGNKEPLIKVLEFYRAQMTFEFFLLPCVNVSQNKQENTLYHAIQELKLLDTIDCMFDTPTRIGDPNVVFASLPNYFHHKTPILLAHPDFNLETSIKLMIRNGLHDRILDCYKSSWFTQFDFARLIRIIAPLDYEFKIKLVHAFAHSETIDPIDAHAVEAKAICELLESRNPSYRERGCKSIEQLIEQQGAIPTSYNVNGWTPFLSAMMTNNQDLVDLILNSQTKIFTMVGNKIDTISIMAFSNILSPFEIIEKISSEISKRDLSYHLCKVLGPLPDTNSTSDDPHVFKRFHSVTRIDLDQDIHTYFTKLGILDWITFDPNEQRELIQAVESFVELNPNGVHYLLKELLCRLAQNGLITYKNDLIHLYEKDECARGRLFQKLSTEYKWLTPMVGRTSRFNLTSKNVRYKKEMMEYGTISLKSFYSFLNELTQSLIEIHTEEQKALLTIPVISSLTPKISTPQMTADLASSTSTNEENTIGSPKYKRFRDSNYPEKKSLESSKPIENSKRKGKGKTKGKGKEKEINSTRNGGKKNAPKSKDSNLVVESNVGPADINLSVPLAPYTNIGSPDKPLDFPIQENNLAISKAKAPKPELPVRTSDESKFISNVISHNELNAEFLATSKDKQTATMALRLACLYNLFKMNRQLAINDKNFFKFHCDLIHGTHETILAEFKEPNLERSSFWQFLINSFKNDAFKYHEAMFRENEAFSISSKEALHEPSTKSATLKRLLLIRHLIDFIKSINPSLNKDNLHYQIFKNAFAASIVILGEQYARLKEFTPQLASKLNDTAAGAIFIKYRDYRNMHHGVNSIPTLKTFNDSDEEYQVFINFDKDWDDQIIDLINTLENDIYCLSDFLLKRNIHSMISELENDLASPPLIYSDFKSVTTSTASIESNDIELLNRQVKNLKFSS